LQYPDGHVYVGKSHDIDARVAQHKAGVVSTTSRWRGIPKEIAPLTSAPGNDWESFERNETLAQMLKHGIEKVRGWMYTAPKLTENEEDAIKSQLCEKYDLCRKCGQAGHFAAQCRARPKQREEDDEDEDDDEEDEDHDYDDEEDD